MSVPRVYLDTNVFIAAFEMTGAHSDHAWWILKGIEAGTIIGVTSEITLAEVLVKPMERDDEALADAYEGMIAPAPYFETVSVGRDVLTTAPRLRAGRHSLRLPDAIHVASAQIAQCSVFITQDERIALPDDLRRLGVTPFTLDDILGQP
ncbi:PIN domain-containing protein [Azorhizobium caulinodans]|uniref:type II toxin-antitoxin system VapC family toxin n=1 Tax=Azorhizobium caulinodans TaxID=7 RepID=UPI002FBEE0B0